MSVANKIKAITTDTLIPIGTVVLVLYYAGSWVVRVETTGQAFQDHVAESQKKESALVEELRTERELLSSIDRRLSVIEGEVKRIRR